MPICHVCGEVPTYFWSVDKPGWGKKRKRHRVVTFLSAASWELQAGVERSVRRAHMWDAPRASLRHTLLTHR